MTNDSTSVASKVHIPTGMRAGSYCLITPCRDEAQYGRRTIEAVKNQTKPPALWVIVDDGSTDATPQILAEYAAQLPYVRIVRSDDRGFRHVGAGVMQAFYRGVDAISPDEWNSVEYICKLDLDLDFPPNYFEEVIRRMDAEPRLATGSGSPYFTGPDGTMISEMCGSENSVGMIKFYRRSAWEQIGGFIRELTWDAIDCHICRLHGWYAQSWDDPSIRIHHLRPMGSSQKNWWTGRNRHGKGQWYMGTALPYMIASGAFRMSRPPYVVGGLGMLWGYLGAMFTRTPRFPDPEVRRFIRRYQYACLLMGKERATERLDKRQRDVWLRGRARNAATVSSRADVGRLSRTAQASNGSGNG